MLPLPNGYLNSIDTLSYMQPSAIIHSVSTLLNRQTDIGLFNRYLFDSVNLLQGKWKANEDWGFTDIHKLIFEPDEKDLPKELIKDLKSKLKNAQNETFYSFNELKKNVPQFNDSIEYLDWFNKYIPYLIVDLKNDENAYKNAQIRLQWFLAQDPDKEESQLESSLQSYGSRYIMAWQDQQPSFK